MSKLTVTSSPHIYTPRTTRSIMLDVLIALLPAAVASVIIFGFSSLIIILTCMAAAVLSELVFNLICKKEQTIGDLSSAVTGLLLALNLPATIPMWQAALGSVFAIIVVKCLFGGIYLVIRGVITWHTPVVFIATVFLFSLVLGQDPVAEILSGGLFIGAIFMATDYATTPNTAWGKVIFGVGCGLITVLIRVFGSYPEGVSFSILLMNILTPYIERWTRTKPFGGAKS